MAYKQNLKHGSLFSGIGGFDLASEWMGWENIFQVEIDEFCQRVLQKNFPKTNKYYDIKKFDGTKYRGTIDIITGGFPCQPFSQAGKRKGSEDERALFPEMLRVIREVRPRWVVAENVGGIISIDNGDYFEEVCSQLQNEGYEVQPVIIPASSINAPHRRDRVWFVAHDKRTGLLRLEQEGSWSRERQILQDGQKRGEVGSNRTGYCGDDVAYTESGESRKQTEQERRENISGGNKQTSSDTEITGLHGSDTEGSSSAWIRSSEHIRSVEQGNASDTPTERDRRCKREESEKGESLCGSESSADTECKRLQRPKFKKQSRPEEELFKGNTGWDRNWIEVATELCSVDDGLPVELGGFKLSKARHRIEQLKAYGNAIVPQVAYLIFKTINQIERSS